MRWQRRWIVQGIVAVDLGVGACRAPVGEGEAPSGLATPPSASDALPLALTVHYVPNLLAARGAVTMDPDAPIGELAMAYGRVGEALDQRTPPQTVGPGDQVELPVLGLAPGEWSVAAVLDGEVGALWTVTTSLPDDVAVGQVTMAALVFDDDLVVCCATKDPHAYRCEDQLGTPRAYVPLVGPPKFVRALSDGTWLVHPDIDGVMLQMDRLGRAQGAWRLDDLTGFRFVHDEIDVHDVVEIRDGPWAGAWATLTRTWDHDLVGAGIVVFDPRTREVLWDWSAHGVLGDGRSIDPDALPYSRDGTEPERPRDWLHANALAHGRADSVDHFWVSLRHQDWVVRIDATTDRVALRVGAGGDVMLVQRDEPEVEADAVEWMYHQHAPKWTPSDGGTMEMMLVDNGNTRPGGDPYSRLVRYVLSADRATAWVDWSYGGPEPSEQHFVLPTAGDIDAAGPEGVRFTHHDDDAGWVSQVGWDGALQWQWMLPGHGELYRTESYASLYDADEVD